MAARMSSRRIVGLSWRKLSKSTLEGEGSIENLTEPASPPSEEAGVRTKSSKDEKRELKRASIGRRILRSFNSDAAANLQTRVLQRALSVRTALGTLRQKIKTSTKQRKRLMNSTPSPFGRVVRSSTPGSSQRRSERLLKREIKMYSPFGFNSPARTPSQPKMGTHEPKRFNFSSPGSFDKDVAYLADEMHYLTNLSNDWSSPSTKTPRSGIRTTPRVSRTSARKKPLFV